jgi:hypothetical protein
MGGRKRLFLAACSGLLFLALPASASGFPDESLASALVQARTQQRILKDDDAADASCQQRQFSAAKVVRRPEVVDQGAVPETKWQEHWTLIRCGHTIGYRVFFTEVGGGGTYFAVVRAD